MKQLFIKPVIYKFDTCAAFAAEFGLCSADLILTNAYIFEPCFGPLHLPCQVICQEDYGTGEPSDEMAEAIGKDLRGDFNRVIAIGGGTVIDLAKLFALKTFSPILDLYDGKTELVKEKQLILVPTTCGTGSEVTNISILALHSRGTKKGLADDALYADAAVLIPQLLEGLPFSIFATSSIDALVHAVESSLSPKATPMTRLFGYQAIKMIVTGYQKIARDGPEARIPLLAEFLQASNYAGIAFGNAGCAAVHALSYPLGAKYHVAHGESNYALFTGVMNQYMALKSDGEIAVLNAFLAELLGCGAQSVYPRLEELLNTLLRKKPLHAYGVTEQDLTEFTDSVMTNQSRLMANNFVELNRDMVYKIYQGLY